MWNTWTASPKDTSTASSSASLPSPRRVGACDEEVEQDRLGARRPATSMYPPAPRPVSSGSVDERGEHRGDAPRRRRCRRRAAPRRRPRAVTGCPAATTPVEVAASTGSRSAQPARASRRAPCRRVRLAQERARGTRGGAESSSAGRLDAAAAPAAGSRSAVGRSRRQRMRPARPLDGAGLAAGRSHGPAATGASSP